MLWLPLHEYLTGQFSWFRPPLVWSSLSILWHEGNALATHLLELHLLHQPLLPPDLQHQKHPSLLPHQRRSKRQLLKSGLRLQQRVMTRSLVRLIVYTFVLCFKWISPASQMKTWTSGVYSHFRSPPTIIVEGGVVKYKFTCRKPKCVSSSFYFIDYANWPRIYSCKIQREVTRTRTDESTSNLNRHVKSCDQKATPPGQAITDFAHGSTYNKAEFWYLVSLWVTQCHRPFAIVEDPPLLQIFRMLYAKVDVPSATTVSRDVKEIFQLSKVNVGKVLQVRTSIIPSWAISNIFRSRLQENSILVSTVGRHQILFLF